MLSDTVSSCRPAASQRCFSSAVVEDLIARVTGAMDDAELAWLFGNCFPNTLDTTVQHAVDALGQPDTFVITGDIDAMWLRDSAAQVWPFLPLTEEDKGLRTMISGVVRRQAKSVLLDPYANAFYRDPVLGYWQTDLTEMRPGVHERKWELDSLAYFLRLSYGYWAAAKDLGPFDGEWKRAVNAVLSLLRVEQKVGEDPYRSPYSWERPGGRKVPSDGHGLPGRACGLIRCGFRPSDDMVRYPYLVPANAMMAKALSDIVPLLVTLEDEQLAAEAASVAADIAEALETHAVVRHPHHGEIWAYEVDGFGGVDFMDDANVPSLLAMPYLGLCSPSDPRYLRTRSFCLSVDNPHYVAGGRFCGIGSPHTGPGTIWPMALVMQALTAVEDSEIVQCLSQLKASHAGTGFMHESFRGDNPDEFSRPWFAWANTLFGELIVKLYLERPHLLRAKLS